MSKKKGFSILETIIPMVRLLPPARWRAWGLGWYFSSSIALITRARVDVLTTLALFSTRETVAVETLARRATCSRFMSLTLYKISQVPHLPFHQSRDRKSGRIAGITATAPLRSRLGLGTTPLHFFVAHTRLVAIW